MSFLPFEAILVFPVRISYSFVFYLFPICFPLTTFTKMACVSAQKGRISSNSIGHWMRRSQSAGPTEGQPSVPSSPFRVQSWHAYTRGKNLISVTLPVIWSWLMSGNAQGSRVNLNQWSSPNLPHSPIGLLWDRWAIVVGLKQGPGKLGPTLAYIGGIWSGLWFLLRSWRQPPQGKGQFTGSCLSRSEMKKSWSIFLVGNLF